MNDKGISPLIATVLLIGFVVALGSVVMLWGKGFVKEKTEKEGALSQAKLDCEGINLKVIEASTSAVIVENRGTSTVNGFKVKYYGGSEDGNIEDLFMEIKTMGRIEIPPEGADKIDIIPCIKPEGVGAPLVPCSDKHKLVNIQ